MTTRFYIDSIDTARGKVVGGHRSIDPLNHRRGWGDKPWGAPQRRSVSVFLSGATTWSPVGPVDMMISYIAGRQDRAELGHAEIGRSKSRDSYHPAHAQPSFSVTIGHCVGLIPESQPWSSVFFALSSSSQPQLVSTYLQTHPQQELGQHSAEGDTIRSSVHECPTLFAFI